MLSVVACPPGWCVMTQLPTRWSVSRPLTAEAAATPALPALALKSHIRMREIVHLQAGLFEVPLSGHPQEGILDPEGPVPEDSSLEMQQTHQL